MEAITFLRSGEAALALPPEVAPGSPSWVVSHGDFGHQTIYQDDNDHDHHIIIQDGEKYDCTIGLSSWKTAWSKEKRAWCLGTIWSPLKS